MTFYNNYYFLEGYTYTAVSFSELVQMYIDYTKADLDDDESPFTDFDEWLAEGMQVYITDCLPEDFPDKYRISAEIASFLESQEDHQSETTFNERFLQIAFMLDCEPDKLTRALKRYNCREATDLISEINKLTTD